MPLPDKLYAMLCPAQPPSTETLLPRLPCPPWGPLDTNFKAWSCTGQRSSLQSITAVSVLTWDFHPRAVSHCLCPPSPGRPTEVTYPGSPQCEGPVNRQQDILSQKITQTSLKGNNSCSANCDRPKTNYLSFSPSGNWS